MSDRPADDKNANCCKRMCLFAGPLFGFIMAIVLFLAINFTMEKVSSDEYCGTTCHEMQTVYEAWKLTNHAANARGLTSGCVDCHLPPKDQYFRHLTAKGIAGMTDLWAHLFGEEYDGDKLRQEVLEEFDNSHCTHCHKNLLIKPSSDVARESHEESLNPSDPEEKVRCVVCHDDAGHVR